VPDNFRRSVLPSALLQYLEVDFAKDGSALRRTQSRLHARNDLFFEALHVDFNHVGLWEIEVIPALDPNFCNISLEDGQRTGFIRNADGQNSSHVGEGEIQKRGIGQ
jgi:hypothetical protein